jgi:hypothetical protein
LHSCTVQETIRRHCWKVGRRKDLRAAQAAPPSPLKLRRVPRRPLSLPSLNLPYTLATALAAATWLDEHPGDFRQKLRGAHRVGSPGPTGARALPATHAGTPSPGPHLLGCKRLTGPPLQLRATASATSWPPPRGPTRLRARRTLGPSTPPPTSSGSRVRVETARLAERLTCMLLGGLGRRASGLTRPGSQRPARTPASAATRLADTLAASRPPRLHTRSTQALMRNSTGAWSASPAAPPRDTTTSTACTDCTCRWAYGATS